MVTNGTRARGYLLASTALLALPGIAHAQTARPTESLEDAHSTRPVSVLDEAQTARPTTVVDLAQEIGPRTGTGYVSPVDAVDTPQVTINNNFTPTDVRDPTNITGIGQVVTDAGGGSVGLCTGTLINPRVILYAAHCVNTRAATAYGANTGGVGIAVAFETNTRANAAGQPDELVNWLTGGSTGPGRFQTNRAQQLYNISQVFWNPLSVSATSCTAPGSCFLEADVATAVLDAPTRNVPTWALLFSPLVSPASINPATGTGYHVTIDGYGQNGNGTTGATGTDFRRRIAENILGALTSLNDRNLFLFGTTGSPSRPQVLYWMDFDDPARGTAAANPRDFNGFRDNALPREGITGPGDSGGPLILDQTFSRQVVIGTLSGGSTFFTGQPQSSYGTQSFYQPLFLYWDWIVANNPYRYVTATAGNRNWEDATGWVTTLDPAYNILVGGQLVNGLPTNLGGGVTANSPQFGEFCFQSPLNSSTPPVDNECQNTNGTVRNNVPNNPSDQAPTNGVLTEQIGDDVASAASPAATGSTAAAAEGSGRLTGGANDTAISGRDDLDGAVDSPQADPGFSNTPAPAPTLANGLPGATNFVPNNVDGVRATGVQGRYYDVTLRNTGVVTLNSAVTIDRFTISGATAQLNVATGASLTSLIDITQMTGTVVNNGTITTGGDYFVQSGLLSGSGRVNTPFLTNLLGSIAPGTIGTVGTMTLGGNLVLSSGSTLLIDLAGGTSSDVLAVVAGSGNTGTATLGGRVLFSGATGSTLRAGETYTFLTAAGGRTGTFQASSSFSAILTPNFIYNANSVQVQIVAGLYANVVGNTPVQQAYARLLDNNRAANRTRLGGLYDFLDLQSAATISSTLEGLAPRTETLTRSLGTAAVDNMDRFYRGRIESMDLGGFDGSLAIVGSPLQVLATSAASGGAAAGGAAVTTSVQPDAQIQPGRLPDGVRGFIAGGYLDGKGRSMPTAVPFGGKDNFDGWYVAAGIEAMAGDNSAIGFGVSYTDLDGTTGGVAQRVGGEFYQGTLYGKTQTDSGIVLDGRLSAGILTVSTRRAAIVGPTTYDLRSKDNTLAVSSEVGIAKLFGDTIKFGPRIAARASNIGFSKTTETGGPAALYLSRNDKGSAQGLAGLTLGGGSLRFKPYASAYYVHDFLDQPASFGANFVGGAGGNALFAVAGQDKDWGEVAVGVTFGGEKVSFSVGADTTIFRKDVENQAYRGSLSIKF